MTQRALFQSQLSVAEIETLVDRLSDQRRYVFWERVGLVSGGLFDGESIRAVWERHSEGGG